MFENLFQPVFCGSLITDRKTLSAQLASAQARATLLSDSLAADDTKISSILVQLQQAQDALKASSDSNAQLVANLQNEKATLQNQVNSQVQTIDTLYAQSDRSTDFTMLPQSVQTIVLGYESKYPEAEVTYSGRVLPGYLNDRYDMHVQNFTGGINSPEAMECVTAANAYVMDIVKAQNVSFHRACDIALMRIMIWRTNGFPYVYQDESVAVAGLNEIWKNFFELFYGAKNYKIYGNCHDWAPCDYVLWRTAGIPKEIIRVRAGVTRDGQGHATNSYFASDLTWRHPNSTTPFRMGDALNLPKLDDATDIIGLATTWFSFNEERSWTGTDSTSAGDTLTDFEEKLGMTMKGVGDIFKSITVRRK